MGRQISRLPASVVSHLRSSTILSNVAQIAEELVCNSLDAGATAIEVAVDGEACHMKIDDDDWLKSGKWAALSVGFGISRDDLAIVGERHATSKLHCLDELEEGVATLGFRGEALSSLSDVALVEITSRCRGMPNTYRKILKGCKTVSIGLCSEQRTNGTTVTVRDMFYNQPVRRRLLTSSHRKISQSVKERVLHLVLIHPQVSFTVKDLVRKEVLLHTKGAATLNSTLCDMFGEEIFNRLQEVDYAQGHLRLSGFLSKTYQCHPSKAFQYFYINRRYVLKTAFHKLLNSWVGPYAGKCKDLLGQINYEAEKGGKAEMLSGKHLYPAFVLNMACPLSDYDITFEASKTLVEFKDWMPVVSFVKSILQEVWGDQSVCKSKGFFQAPSRSSEGSLKKASSNGNIDHHTSAEHNACGKEVFPPMAVRRALVQSDSRRPCSSSEDVIAVDKATASSEYLPEKPETAPTSTVPSTHLSGREMTRMAPCFAMNSEQHLLTDIGNELQTGSDSDSDDKALPRKNWSLTPCRQRRTSDQPVTPLALQMEEPFPSILGSDWFSKGILSPEPKEQHHLHSDSAAFTPLFSSDRTSAFPAAKDQCTRRSVASKRWLSSSLSPTDTCGNPLDRSMENCRNSELGASFSGHDDGRYLSPVQTTDEKYGEKWWGPADSKLETSFWSGSDDSTGIPRRTLYTSAFLPEFNSYSVEGASSEGHHSLDWKWAESDSDHRESHKNWMPKMQTKRQRLKEIDGSDSDGRDDFFLARSCSFQPDSDGNLGSVQITNKANCNGWKVYTEKSREDLDNGVEYGNEAGFVEETNGDINFPTNSEIDLHALQSHGYDIEVNSYKPRSKRRLDLNFDHGSGNLKIQTDHFEKQKPSKVDEVQHVSPVKARHPQRRHSGPPFYKAPKRHGLHGNPLNSLSTANSTVNIAEDAVVMGTEKDSRSEIQPNAPYESNPTRDEGKNRMEHMENTSIDLGEPGQDSIGQVAIQSTPSLNQDQLCKDRESADIQELAECHVDAGESIQPTLEMDVHQHSKYRSSDVNSTGMEGAELPMDTVKTMLKEWSNPCMKKDDDILDLSSGILASSNSSLLPGSITKDVLKLARVLQQVDTKFIASVSCGILLLIDQHAADERVRLEELRKDVLGGNIKKQISLLSRSQELTITFAEQQTLQTYHRQIQDWGWRYKISVGKQPLASQRPGFSTAGVCKLLLSAVPSILGVSLTAADLTEYLRQLTNTRNSSAPPPAVIRLLNYKACRGAIMFGDALLPSECNQLVEHLKRTLLCFQCAHGRPTMVPLVDLQALHKRFDHTSSSSSRKGAEYGPTVPKPDASRGQWHGLQAKVKPSLERAQARLRRAQGV